MKFKDFENVISIDRMRRYVKACNGDVQKGMTLYRNNLALVKLPAHNGRFLSRARGA